jgi:reticulon-4-interacting protein 1, mitochondrial
MQTRENIHRKRAVASLHSSHAFFSCTNSFDFGSLTALQALSPHIVPNQSSVLIIGGSGGTGHVALQVATCLQAASVTTICSARNGDFCKAHGATHVVDYTAPKPPSSAAEPWLIDQLRPLAPFDVILDCVTSDDPRDQQIDYPQLIQAPHRRPPLSSSNNGTASLTLVQSDSYVYRRLGGATAQWIRAGLERTIGPWIGPRLAGLWFWPHPSDRLFWIRMHQTSQELRQLSTWAQAGQLRPHVGKVYTFTAAQVQEAYDAILSRRVQGKVVVSVWSPPVDEKED